MDKTTKVLLAAGLWANALRPALAQNYGQNDPLTILARDVDMIAMGSCPNQKLC